MAGYADLTVVHAELKLSANNPDDVPRIAKVAALNEALSRAFDREVGRTYGTAALGTRTFFAPADARVLLFDAPVKGITAVAIGGTWNGTAWASPTVLTTADYTPWNLDSAGFMRGMYRAASPWYSAFTTAPDVPVVVTGYWQDAAQALPLDVVAALTEAVTAAYRRETFNARDSQRGFDDPNDPSAATPPSPLNGPLWKAAIETHRTRRLVVA